MKTDELEDRVADVIRRLRRAVKQSPTEGAEGAIHAILAEFGRSEAALEAGRIRDLLSVLIDEPDCPPVIARVCEALTSRVATLLRGPVESSRSDRTAHARATEILHQVGSSTRLSES